MKRVIDCTMTLLFKIKVKCYTGELFKKIIFEAGTLIQKMAYYILNDRIDMFNTIKSFGSFH